MLPTDILVDTTWAADAPYTLTNATRSGGKLIIDGNPALDSYATYTLATSLRPKSGSARGMAIAFHLTDFSSLVTPAGGLAPVVKLTPSSGATSDLQVKTSSAGTTILTWNGADSSALTNSTNYQIDGLYTDEGALNVGRARLWINGSLAFDQRSATLGINDLAAIQHGLVGGLAKITYEFRFGHTKIWSMRDAT